MKIIRFSPCEEAIPDYAGCDHLIRFYKDEHIYNGYTGTSNSVFGFSKRVSTRPSHVSYNIFKEITKGFDPVILGYSNGNLDIPSYEVPENELVDHMGRFACMVYTGTWPASYSLGFIEAMMIGVPMVCLGNSLWFNGQNPYKGLYEIPSIIHDEYNGFVCESIEYARIKVSEMIYNKHYRSFISENGRKRAIEIFGKETIKKQWINMLKEFV